MTRTHRIRTAVLAAALLAVASTPALAGDSADTARLVAAQAPDAFERAVARLAPAAGPAGAAAPAPDWPERAASGRPAAVPSDVSDRVRLSLLPGRSGLALAPSTDGGVEWGQVGLGALGGALLAALAAVGARPLRRTAHG